MQRLIVAILFIFTSVLSGCSNSLQHSMDFVQHEMHYFAASAFFERFIGGVECVEADRVSSDILEGQLEACEFPEDIEIKSGRYTRCLNDTLNSFLEISSDSCKKKYLNKLIEVNRNLVLRHIRDAIPKSIKNIPMAVGAHGAVPAQVGSTDQVDSFEMRLKPLISHLDRWVDSFGRTIFRNQGIISLFENTEKLPKGVAPDTHMTAEERFNNELSQFSKTIYFQLSKLVDDADSTAYLSAKMQSPGIPEALNERERGMRLLTRFNELAAPRMNARLLGSIWGYILGDIRPRFQVFAELSDLACDLSSCRPRYSKLQEETACKEGSPIEHAYRILGSLNQPSMLNTSEKVLCHLDALQKSGENFSSLYAFLNSLWIRDRNQQSAANRVYQEIITLSQTEDTVSRLSDIDRSHIPEYLRGYLDNVSALWAQSDSLKNTGYFFGDEHPTLNFGLTQNRIEKIGIQIKAVHNELDQTIKEVKQAQQSHAAAIRGGNDLSIREIELQSELKTDLEELSNYRHDLKGAQSLLLKNEKYSMEGRIRDLLSSPQWQVRYQGQQLNVKQYPNISISGTDAKFRSGTHFKISDLAVQKGNFASFEAENEDILTFQVSGEWSPSCAISKSIYHDLARSEGIGPEGYSLQISKDAATVASVNDYDDTSDFSSKSKNHSISDTSSSSVSLGLKVTADLGFKFLGSGSGVQAYADTKTSQSRDETTTNSTSSGSQTSSGKRISNDILNENRNSARFALGIRLEEHTPFPEMPAGSLLLVELPQHTAHSFINPRVRILHRQTTIVATQSSRYFLIVNDCNGLDTRELSVRILQERPALEVARHLSQKMQSVVKWMDEREAELIKSGEIASSHLNSLKSTARAELALGGFAPEDVPLLTPLFENWIDRQIDNMSLKIRILQIQRRIIPLISQIERLQKELEVIGKNQQNNEIVQSWIREEFRLSKIRSKVESVVYVLRNQAIPILRVRYPQVFNTFKRQGEVELSQMNWGQDSGEIITSLGHVMAKLNTTFTQLALNERHGKTIITMNFPKPNLTTMTPLLGQQNFITPIAPFSLTLEPFQALQISLNPPEDPDEHQVDEYFIHSMARFKINPKDFYKLPRKLRGFSSGGLECNMLLPVVDKMGLYIQMRPQAIDEEGLNLLNRDNRALPIKLTSDTIFIHHGEEYVYSLASHWKQSKISVRFGDTANGVSAFDSFSGTSHFESPELGFSPFGDYEVDLVDYNRNGDVRLNDFNKVQNIQLIFQVDFIHGETAKPCR